VNLVVNKVGESIKREDYIGAFPKEDRFIILIFLIILSIAPLVPLPDTPITPPTQDSFAAIENVPDGGTFLWCTDFGMGMWYEQAPAEVAVFRHMFQRVRDDDCKIVFVTTSGPDPWFVVQRLFRDEVNPDDYGAVYGEDYVLLGWIPGYESTLAGLLSDLKGITSNKDYQGTALSDLPMMADLNEAGDFHLLGYSLSTSPEPYTRQWGVGVGLNNVPVMLKDGTESPGALLICNINTGGVPWVMPYIEAGIQTSYISGQRGGAEYEDLLNEPGAGLGFMAGQSLGHFFAIALIIGTNAYYFYSRSRRT
jgi:hypothetical protein